ncbi:unnamed protein product [Arabis nemorensis]|uniref:Uncharacterized protein n=1 Tax=Arabis nemorensis TaxID=586526 RepID=A0A565BPJ5_9BRAS|nr:unnamed protein product [Arabis nemorensis]
MELKGSELGSVIGSLGEFLIGLAVLIIALLNGYQLYMWMKGRVAPPSPTPQAPPRVLPQLPVSVP